MDSEMLSGGKHPGVVKMKVLDELVKSVKIDGAISKVIIGLYTTIVANTNQAGLSSTLYFEETTEHHRHIPIRDAGELHLKSPEELCTYCFSDIITEAAVGMATINSYLNVDISKYSEINAFDILAERGAGKRVVIIGNFPFTDRIRKSVSQLSVFDRAIRDGVLPPEQMPAVLPAAEVVAITGTSLINRTFDDIMTLVDDAAFTVMLGPTTPLSPLLFNYGVDVLCGSIVADADLVENCICQAVPFRFIRGVRHVALLKD